MTFTEAELDYLSGQWLGRLATSQPDGTLQVTPVGFRYNPSTETIDIVGRGDMAESRKFRNVADNGRVAFVVDDVPSQQPLRIRCLEIRGHAEAIEDPAGDDGPMIRIHPRRIITLGIVDPDTEPRLLTHHSRNVAGNGQR